MANGHISEEWFRKYWKYYGENYPVWWDRTVKEWHDDEYNRHVWVTGSSSYFVRLGNVLFAVDPIWLQPYPFDALADRLEKDLQCVDFILITHEHDDHFSAEQVQKLSRISVHWIVPWCMEEMFRTTGVPEENCVFLNPGDSIDIKGIQIHAFLGHHHYLNGKKAVESLMYTVKSSDRHLFFPADLRDFNTEFIPKGEAFDAVFLHMYLDAKDRCAYPFSEYYKPIVEYAAALDTRLLFIGHLNGLHCGTPDLMWTFSHVGMLEDGLFCLRPDMEVADLRVGRRYFIAKNEVRQR